VIALVEERAERPGEYAFCRLCNGRLNPPLPPALQHRFNLALKKLPRVLEVLFGVGFGGGDCGERLVQDAHDPPLLGNWGNRNRQGAKFRRIEAALSAACRTLLYCSPIVVGLEE